MSRGFESRVCPKHSWASTNSPCPHCWDALIVDPRDAEITRLRAELAEARVGEERYQCLLHNVGLIHDLAKSWNPVTNGKLIDYLNLQVAAIVARTTKSSV
jgi:hypothetical protein